MNICDGDQNARFFHITKVVVVGGAESFHGWWKPHVDVEERRNGFIQIAHILVQDFEAFFVIGIL